MTCKQCTHYIFTTRYCQERKIQMPKWGAYTSGTLNQISAGPGLTPPVGAQLSDILMVRILRDNANTSGAFAGADPYTAAVSFTSVDIHIKQDTIGSRQQFIK